MPTLKDLRLERFWTQEELAERIGARGATVANWESGRAEPRLRMIPRLAEALGITTAEVIAAVKETQREKARREQEERAEQLVATA